MLADGRDEGDQGFSEEARARADRAHAPVGAAMHLAVKHPSRAGSDFGETIYLFTLWILRRMGSDSKGSKIGRRELAGKKLEMPLGENGEDWKTISITQWWVGMKEYFSLHVFVSPIEIWEMLMEWNKGIRNPMRKLGIGNTGNACQGNPAANALLGVIERVGTNSLEK